MAFEMVLSFPHQLQIESPVKVHALRACVVSPAEWYNITVFVRYLPAARPVKDMMYFYIRAAADNAIYCIRESCFLWCLTHDFPIFANSVRASVFFSSSEMRS